MRVIIWMPCLVLVRVPFVARGAVEPQAAHSINRDAVQRSTSIHYIVYVTLIISRSDI